MLKEDHQVSRLSNDFTDCTASSETSSCERSIGGSWDDDGDGDTRIALLPVESTGQTSQHVFHRTKDSTRNRSIETSKLNRKFSLVGLLAAAFFVGLLAGRTNIPIQDVTMTKPISVGPSFDLIKNLGWVNLMENLRLEISLVAAQMGEHENDFSGGELSELIDITPFVEKMNEILDTVGVRGVYADLFDGLQEYVPGNERKDCDGHGAGCKPNSFWWLCHYTGALTADKLLKDGSLLLDGITGERIYDGTSFMTEIHVIQQRPYAGKMSFHAEHAFLWHYVAATMPDLDDYPHELADSFCSEFLTNKVRNHAAKKYLGLECYHGIGHAVYYVLARRQKNFDPASLTATVQFRPKGGIALDEETFCHGYNDICLNAPNITDTPVERCRGGMRHSQRLFLGYKNKDRVDRTVDGLVDTCLRKLLE